MERNHHCELLCYKQMQDAISIYYDDLKNDNFLAIEGDFDDFGDFLELMRNCCVSEFCENVKLLVNTIFKSEGKRMTRHEKGIYHHVRKNIIEIFNVLTARNGLMQRRALINDKELIIPILTNIDDLKKIIAKKSKEHFDDSSIPNLKYLPLTKNRIRYLRKCINAAKYQ